MTVIVGKSEMIVEEIKRLSKWWNVQENTAWLPNQNETLWVKKRARSILKYKVILLVKKQKNIQVVRSIKNPTYQFHKYQLQNCLLNVWNLILCFYICTPELYHYWLKWELEWKLWDRLHPLVFAHMYDTGTRTMPCDLIWDQTKHNFI